MTRPMLQAPIDSLIDFRAPQEVEIATLTRYDIPAIAALHVIAHESPETAESLWTETDEIRLYFDGAFGHLSDDSYVGAWHNGSLVGAAACVTDAALDEAPPGPFVLDIVVDPQYQHHGIGKALIGELARRCQRRGEDSMILNIHLRPDSSHHSSLRDSLTESFNDGK